MFGSLHGKWSSVEFPEDPAGGEAGHSHHGGLYQAAHEEGRPTSK